MKNIIVVLFVLLLILFLFCGQNELGKIVQKGATVEKINKDINFSFTEGPAWDGKGNLFFTDVPNKKIYKLSSEGNFSIFRDETESANGLMFNINGNLVACEGGGYKVTEMDSEGKVIKILAKEYNGKPFNSPNDVVVDKKGGIYFTDPSFSSNQNLNQDKETVYYIKPGGEVIRVTDKPTKPNGIILSKDEKILYVDDTFGLYVWAFDVADDGTLMNERHFCELKLPESKERLRNLTDSGADGMAIDSQGNLYVTTRVGVQIFNRNGKRIGILEIPERPSNCTFGGEGLKILFITAQTSVYKIKLNVEGLLFPQVK